MKTIKPKVCHTSFKGVSGFVSVVRPDGRETQKQRIKNLILDQGLDLVGTQRTNMLTRYLAYGDGTAPTQRDSSTTTASRTGNAVSSSANFFEAADVGRLGKWDSGEEDYISGFTDAQNVTTVNSGTIASGEFTIWHVDDTGLANELGRISTFRTDSGDNQTTESAGVVNHKRTHLSTAFGAAATVRELGWSDASGAGNNLFNRVLLGSAISLQIGDQLKVESNLELTQSPQTSTAQTPTASGDWTTQLDGNMQIEGYGLSEVETSGLGGVNETMDSSGNSCEPGIVGAFDQLCITVDTDAFNSYGTAKTTNLTNIITPTQSTYSSGSYTRNKLGTFSTAQGNVAIGGIGLTGNNSSIWGLRHKPTTPPTKDSDHTLLSTFKFTWGRTLVN